MEYLKWKKCFKYWIKLYVYDIDNLRLTIQDKIYFWSLLSVVFVFIINTKQIIRDYCEYLINENLYLK